MNHLRGHSINIKNQKRRISLQCWGEITLNMSYLHDKINQGEFVELPDRMPKKMRNFEANQKLQIFEQKAFGKKHFPKLITLNYLLQNV